MFSRLACSISSGITTLQDSVNLMTGAAAARRFQQKPAILISTDVGKKENVTAEMINSIEPKQLSKAGSAFLELDLSKDDDWKKVMKKIEEQKQKTLKSTQEQKVAAEPKVNVTVQVAAPAMDYPSPAGDYFSANSRSTTRIVVDGKEAIVLILQ